MNRTEQIKKYAELKGKTEKEAKADIETYCGMIEETLKSGDKFVLGEFGSLELRYRGPRVSRNPQDPSVEINVPERVAVCLNESKAVKTMMADPEIVAREKAKKQEKSAKKDA